MSKSIGNIVNPKTIIDEYGADTARLFILFGAPVQRDLDWSDTAVEGCYRFLKRAYQACLSNNKHPDPEQIKKVTHKTIQKVSDDIQKFSLNTAISKLMEWVNYAIKHGSSKESSIGFCKLLAPFAPHCAEEIWAQLGESFSVHQQAWPEFDPRLCIEESVTIVAQVNGKVRDKHEFALNQDQASIESHFLAQDKIQQFTKDKEIRKIIYVPNKILNIVV